MDSEFIDTTITSTRYLGWILHRSTVTSPHFAMGCHCMVVLLIGLERWMARIVGAENLREVTHFPRDLTRLTP